ncbi:hypothetical protein BGW36DRAFT_448494 [Talaromyces proteolyticus]|uniref:Uncharacterized protein n=1 Tax=Talaromyces proteolyticus TaxID=1131652 RepID=A0AAD4KR08_9EURO|nr:uncharacterized protein BGW36DRAFT_448494 [Talaromyces proteolyticus]KAH8698524.1 hypothetical protein BGW36DRAFT_448494 [Talaromyces proteolyticus]
MPLSTSLASYNPAAQHQEMGDHRSQPTCCLDCSPCPTSPLSIECPIFICVYGITGFYSSWQRYLFIANIALAVIAIPLTVLRGIAQIYVTIMGFISSIVIYTVLTHRKNFSDPSQAAPQTVFDAEYFPACQFFSGCWILSIWWLLLRSGIKGTAILPAGNRSTGPHEFAFDPAAARGSFQQRLQTAMLSAAILVLAIMGLTTVAVVAMDLSE